MKGGISLRLLKNDTFSAALIQTKGGFLMKKAVIAILVSLMLAVWLPALSETLKSPEEFYKGASVYISDGAPPASGAGVAARLFEKYFEKVSGANVVVEYRSGGGGIEGPNVAYVAKPDGLTIGAHMGEVVASNWLLDEPAVAYDLTKFIPIGAINGAPLGLYVKTDGPYNSLEKLKAASNLIVAGASPRGLISTWPTIAAHLLGLDFKLVAGYRGPPGCKLAVMQEEAHMMGVGIHTPGLTPDLKPLVLLSSKRHEILPDVPALPEVIGMTEEGKKMLEIRDILTPFGPALYLPPGVPQDRVDYLRDVYNKITARDDFISEVKKKVGIVWGVHHAEEYEKTVEYLAEHKADFIKIMNLVKKYTK